MDDLIFVNDDGIISDIRHTEPLGKSDHDVLLFDLYIPRVKLESERKDKYLLNKGKRNEAGSW